MHLSSCRARRGAGKQAPRAKPGRAHGHAPVRLPLACDPGAGLAAAAFGIRCDRGGRRARARFRHACDERGSPAPQGFGFSSGNRVRDQGIRRASGAGPGPGLDLLVRRGAASLRSPLSQGGQQLARRLVRGVGRDRRGVAVDEDRCGRGEGPPGVRKVMRSARTAGAQVRKRGHCQDRPGEGRSGVRAAAGRGAWGRRSPF